MGRTFRTDALTLALSLAINATLASACQRDESSKKPPANADGSAETLDGMQLDSARRVALETATLAMQHRDLARLKQLKLWIEKRAQVAILPASDAQALDLAIQCLEHATPPDDAATAIAALGGSKLQSAVREVCGKTGGE